jgi:hypothetical protein
LTLYVDVRGYRVEKLRSVLASQTLSLREIPRLQLELAPWPDLPEDVSAVLRLYPIVEMEVNTWLDGEQGPHGIPATGSLSLTLRSPSMVGFNLDLTNARGRMRRMSLEPLDLTDVVDGDVVQVPVDPAALAATLERLKR